MTQPLFPSTIGTQSRSVKFLTIKTVVRKTTVRPGPSAWTRLAVPVKPGVTTLVMAENHIKTNSIGLQ